MNKFEIPAFRLGDAITGEQAAFFKRYGIIQFKRFADEQTIALFIREVESVQHLLLEHGTKKINGIPLKFGTDVNGSKLIQRIAFTSYYSKKLGEYLKSSELNKLLDLMGPYSGRIGENEKDGLVFNHYVNSETSRFTQLGWHTDSPRDLFLGSRILPMLNIGLHLDDCHSGNGGLRVIPGTHTQGLFRLLFRKKYFIDNHPDKREVGFDIEAGDLTVHDGRLWHRVQQSALTGEASRRRVMYFPIITGPYQPKHAASPTPFYHKLAQIKLNDYAGKLPWANLKTKSRRSF